MWKFGDLKTMDQTDHLKTRKKKVVIFELELLLHVCNNSDRLLIS